MKSEEWCSCYICGRRVKSVELDHFPTPQSLGGVAMLPACRDCHDMKDRHPLDTWEPDVAFTALTGLWAKADASERMMLAKMFHVISQGIAAFRKQQRARKESERAHQ